MYPLINGRLKERQSGLRRERGKQERVENRLLPGRSVDGGVSDKENGVCENGFTLKEKGNWGSVRRKDANRTS